LHSVSLCMLAIAEWVSGRLEDAERGFAAGVAGWRGAGGARTHDRRIMSPLL
jgi:hypothetical protein